jgi:uroporphyrinogen-III decarboxylase
LGQMTNKERMLAVFRGDPVDRVPFMHWDRHFPRGQVEREVRSHGMGLCSVRPCYIESHPNVEMTQGMDQDGTLVRTYHTSEGSVTEKLKTGIGYGQARYGRDWKGITPKRVEYSVKNAEDYDIVMSIVEDTHYEPYYDAIEDAQQHLGDDGIIVTSIGYSPFQRMLIEWVGAQRLYIDFFRNREKIEELYSALAKKQEEIFRIAADSPSEYVGYGDNIDSVIVGRPFFERYHIPMYNKCASIVHRRGKVLGVHMDGRLKDLSEAIARSEVDVLEAFTPPPMGDLPLREALAMWKGKVIWMNFPSSVYILGADAARKHLLQLLREAVPGERLILAASTENVVDLQCLRAITNVMEKLPFPFSVDSIENI